MYTEYNYNLKSHTFIVITMYGNVSRDLPSHTSPVSVVPNSFSKEVENIMKRKPRYHIVWLINLE